MPTTDYNATRITALIFFAFLRCSLAKKVGTEIISNV